MEEQTLQNFRALTKLYGYVRFFHPSDETSSIDWNKLAVYGFEFVENASDDNELRQKLLELFLPIAPAIDIYFTGEKIEYDLKKIIPKDTTGLLPVAWQHKGLGVSKNYLYRSVRSNRINHPVNQEGTISNSIDASLVRGMKLRLRGSALVYFQSENNYGNLWLRTESADGKTISHFDLQDKPIDSSEMGEYEILGEVTQGAERIVFGWSLFGEGMMLINSLELAAMDGEEWKTLNIENPDFESDKVGFAPANWDHTTADYDFEVIGFLSESGKQCCKIESIYERELFDRFPQPGEYFVKSISRNLSCVIPLCLYSDSAGTIPHGNRKLLDALHEELDNLNLADIDYRIYLWLSCIAVTWNVIQHSYPYFDLYEIDWEKLLDEYLISAYKCRNEDEFARVFDEITALINDGHVNWYNKLNPPSFYYPPYAGDFAEGEYVISRLYEEGTGLLHGDAVIEIADRKVSEIIAENASRISSATPERKNKVLLRLLARRKDDSPVNIKIRRNSREMEHSVRWNYKYRQIHDLGDYPEYRPTEICEIEKEIFYVDLTRAGYNDIEKKLNEISVSKGVVFDLRGYPNSNDRILCHLIDEPITSVTWDVPQIIYPDRENPVGYDSGDRWNVEPLKPRIKGIVIFLVDGNAISYSESVMEIVEYFKLGIIVGETTAGTNGNINTIDLPSGYFVNFTGMRVLKHDGSQHHGVGVKPDFPVSRTIKGISEMRDEMLEKAIELIKES